MEKNIIEQIGNSIILLIKVEALSVLQEKIFQLLWYYQLVPNETIDNLKIIANQLSLEIAADFQFNSLPKEFKKIKKDWTKFVGFLYW